MAEISGLWTTAGAPAGDQVVSYTQSLASTMLRIAAACSGFEGVAPGYLNELAPSSTGANNVRIASGGAMVDGKYYSNSANVDFNIISAVGVGNTRIDRIVVKATWGATFTCRLTLVAGVDGAAPVDPILATTSETEYDIPICLVLVDTAGAITITDDRRWAAGGPNSLAANAVTTAKILNDNVTTAKIPNRTRTFFVPALPTASSAFSGLTSSSLGVLLADGVTDDAYCHFFVPSDFVSGMTAVAVVITEATGNCYCTCGAVYGANGQIIDTHSGSFAYTAVACTQAFRTELASISLTDAAAGDYIQLRFIRGGGSANDTIDNEVRLLGWKVSYTADS